jgi:hypothetical protein
MEVIKYTDWLSLRYAFLITEAPFRNLLTPVELITKYLQYVTNFKFSTVDSFLCQSFRYKGLTSY